MQKSLLAYKKRDKEKEYKINLFIDSLSININKFNNLKRKIIKKNKNVIKSFKMYIKNIKYYYYYANKINIDNIKKLKKNYKFIKNYIIDKNIYIYYKNYFPMKIYLISKKYDNYFNGLFHDSNKFYFLFSKIINKNNLLFFLFNDELLKEKKTIINTTNIKILLNYLNIISNMFNNINKYIYKNNGPL
jgi:hypothetical protein